MTLPIAVPPYMPDVAALHQRIGEMSAYQLQLMETLRERAIEANALHDRVLELEDTVARQREELDMLAAYRLRMSRDLAISPSEYGED